MSEIFLKGRCYKISIKNCFIYWIIFWESFLWNKSNKFWKVIFLKKVLKITHYPSGKEGKLIDIQNLLSFKKLLRAYFMENQLFESQL